MTDTTPARTYRRLTLDSATLYDLLSFLLLGKGSYEWAKSAAVAVTTALVRLDHLEIAPGPLGSGPAQDHYATLCTGLTKMRLVHIDNQPPVLDSGKDLIKETEEWAAGSAGKIAEAYLLLRVDPNFGPWLEQSKRAAWREHSVRLKGMFDAGFIPAIGNVFERIPDAIMAVPDAATLMKRVPSKETLGDLLEISKNVGRLIGPEADSSSDLLEGIEHSFIISAIMRGYFHQITAAARKRQLTRHPFRGGVLRHVDESLWQGIATPTMFTVGDTQTYFSNVLLAHALSNDAPEARIHAWLQAVNIAREAYDRGRIELFPGQDVLDAQNIAILAAQKISILPQSKWLDYVFTGATASILGAVPALAHYMFPHAPFPSSDVAMAMVTVGNATFGAVGSKLAKEQGLDAIQNRASYRQLRELATSGPGVIHYNDYRLCKPTSSMSVQPDRKRP